MVITRLTQLFPLWAILGCIVAVLAPQLLTPLKSAIVPLLGVVMFAMGMTLVVNNFLDVMRRPQLVAIGVALQFAIMPLAAWLVGTTLALPPELLVGVVLVGCCPGGVASNVIVYLARGDVALSITLTTVATLLAVVATPTLTWLYIGREVEVPLASMLISVAKIVLLPVLGGVLINTFLGQHLRPVKALLPLLAMAIVVLLIAIIVALNHARLADFGALVVVAVVLHNALGLAAGYGLAALLGLERAVCRTLAIEVGMQNSGLGVALATEFFSPLAALPGAIFSIWHNLSGSLLAGFWGRSSRPAEVVLEEGR